MTRPLQPLVIVTILAGVAALIGSFAAAGWSPGFLLVPIDAVVIAYTPTPVVNWAILTLGEVGHWLHVLAAAGIGIGILGIGGAGGYVIGTNHERPFLGGISCVLWVTGISFLITGALTPALVGAISAAIVTLVAILSPRRSPVPSVDLARRTVLRLSAGVAAYGGLGVLIGRSRGPYLPEPDDAPIPDRGALRDAIVTINDASFSLPNSPRAVSAIGEFYTVDIASSPPPLAGDDWTLTIDGAVGQPQQLTYDQLRHAPVTNAYLALRCIGEPLNGNLMDTAVWTGTPLIPLLEAADPSGEWVVAHGGDGYFETFPRAFLAEALLVYGMNGELLPRAHGYPVRLLMPGTWGKLNVKWLTRLEITTAPSDGFWGERGWEGTGDVHTVAKLWTIRRLTDGRVELGGHAYAGDRGIDRVEVSVNGGETWHTASLGEPVPGEAVTRMWRYRYRSDGPHEVVVRAIDGHGTRQSPVESGPFPDGATGWVHESVDG